MSSAVILFRFSLYLNYLDRFSRKSAPIGNPVVPCGQTDGQTNEAKSGFSPFYERPRNKPFPVPLRPPQIPNFLAGIEYGPPRWQTSDKSQSYGKDAPCESCSCKTSTEQWRWDAGRAVSASVPELCCWLHKMCQALPLEHSAFMEQVIGEQCYVENGSVRQQ